MAVSIRNQRQQGLFDIYSCNGMDYPAHPPRRRDWTQNDMSDCLNSETINCRPLGCLPFKPLYDITNMMPQHPAHYTQMPHNYCTPVAPPIVLSRKPNLFSYSSITIFQDQFNNTHEVNYCPESVPVSGVQPVRRSSLPWFRALPPSLSADMDQVLLAMRRMLLREITDCIDGNEFFSNDPKDWFVKDYKDKVRKLVVSKMENTSLLYKKRNLQNASSQRQDYSTWSTRWAYMYVYMMRHAHLVYHALSRIHLATINCSSINLSSSTASKIPFDNRGLYQDIFLRKLRTPGRVLKICCIGGGPGSDLIGLMLFLRHNGFISKINAYILDRCEFWKFSWESLEADLPPELASIFEYVNYSHFDYYENNLTPFQECIIKNADLVTVMKSLSPVWAKLKATPLTPSPFCPGRKVRQHSLFNILNYLSPASLLLYIDNTLGSHTTVLVEAARAVPGICMLHYEVSKVHLPTAGFSTISREMVRWLGYKPAVSCGFNEIILLSKKYSFE